jgi:excisionase family DNA binding protein
MFDVDALRRLVEDAVRRVVREELAARPTGDVFLSVAKAAEVVEVSSATIRTWIRLGKLTRLHAGRELRVSRAELERLLVTCSNVVVGDDSPEARAARDLGQTP